MQSDTKSPFFCSAGLTVLSKRYDLRATLACIEVRFAYYLLFTNALKGVVTPYVDFYID